MQDCYKPHPSHVMKEGAAPRGRTMDEEKLVEAVRTFDCLWKVSAKVYRDARAKEYAWKAVARTDRTHTRLNPFLLFCLRRSSSSNSSCSSSSVPFAITARVGTKVEPRVNTAYFGLRFSVQCRKDAVL